MTLGQRTWHRRMWLLLGPLALALLACAIAARAPFSIQAGPAEQGGVR